MAIAADTAPCPAGQYYTSAGCTDCPTGQWSESGATSCNQCNKPSGAAFTTNGTNINGCKWEITCAAGNGWNGTACTICTDNRYSTQEIKITGTGASSSAQLCPNICPTNEVTVTDGKSCQCNTPFERNSAGECVGKVYKIALNRNCTFCTVKEKPIYEKYNTGFSYNEPNPSSWTSAKDFKIPAEQNTSRWWGIEFLGYYTSKSGGTQKIDKDGFLVEPNAIQFTSDQTLYARYSTGDSGTSPVTIKYYENNTDPTPKYTATCNIDSNCTIISPTCTSGNEFTGWKCVSGCINSNDILQPNWGPNELLQHLKLTATPLTVELRPQFNQCPSGSFCYCSGTASKKDPCPIGSTSKAGAKAKTDCYIDRNTKFINGDGSEFNLSKTFNSIP